MIVRQQDTWAPHTRLNQPVRKDTDSVRKDSLWRTVESQAVSLLIYPTKLRDVQTIAWPNLKCQILRFSKCQLQIGKCPKQTNFNLVPIEPSEVPGDGV